MGGQPLKLSGSEIVNCLADRAARRVFRTPGNHVQELVQFEPLRRRSHKRRGPLQDCLISYVPLQPSPLAPAPAPRASDSALLLISPQALRLVPERARTVSPVSDGRAVAMR